MNNRDRTGSVPQLTVASGLNPNHGYYELSVVDTKTIQGLSGYVATLEGSTPFTRIVQVIPGSTAYNTIKAL